MKFGEAEAFLLDYLDAGDTVLFKASRGVKLEELVEMIRSDLKKKREKS